MPASSNAIYKAAAALWKPWLDADALLTLSQGTFTNKYHNNRVGCKTSSAVQAVELNFFTLRSQFNLIQFFCSLKPARHAVQKK